MPTPTKEFREFFTRHSQVNGGSKPDQETGFPLTYYVGTVSVFNRFLKGDYPSENVFKKLFESITFKKNVEDTASTTEQGLSRIATDAEARDRTDNGNGTFSNVVKPHHLPDVVLDTVGGGSPDIELSNSSLNGIKLDLVSRLVGGGLFRKVFRIKVIVDKSIVIDGVTQKLQLSGDAASPGANKTYGTDANGVKGWYNCCDTGTTGGGNGVGVATATTYGFSKELQVDGTSPQNLGMLTGDYNISLNAETLITEAGVKDNFGYGIAIAGVPVLEKTFNGAVVSEGFLGVSLNGKITLTGNALAPVTFFISASVGNAPIVKKITDLSASFVINKAV